MPGTNPTPDPQFDLGETEEQALVRLQAMPDVGYPQWVRLAALAVAVLVVLSFIRFPKALAAALAEERGSKHYSNGEYMKAATEFEKVQTAYPDSTKANLELAEACVQIGEGEKAAHALDKLRDRLLGPDSANRADAVASRIKLLYQKWLKEHPEEAPKK